MRRVASEGTARSTSAAATAGGRVARHRAQTRHRLLREARRLIGSDGLEAVTIAELTAEADIGFGTFYSYFASKDDLTHALVIDALERLGRITDALTASLEDPAEVVAAAIPYVLSTVDEDRFLAGFVVRVAFSDQG